MLVILSGALFIQSSAADSLREIAPRLPDSALVEEARRQPSEAREAFGVLLSASARDRRSPGDTQFVTASRIAAAYAEAWRDSFLVRQAVRFAAGTPRQRLIKIEADSLRLAGIAAYSAKGPRAAIAIWQRARARATLVRDSAGLAATLGNIGAAYERLGKVDSAMSYVSRARALAARVGDVRVEATALGEIAGLRESRDDVAGAREAYAQVLELRRRVGDTRGMAADYNNLGLLAQKVGDLQTARTQFESALALNREAARADPTATNLLNLAGLDSREGDLAGATKRYEEALSIWRAAKQPSDAADALRGLGQVALRRGDYARARSDFVEAVALFAESDLPADALAARQDLAGALAATGDLQGAIDELRRAQHIADSLHAGPGIRGGIALARADLAVQMNARSDADRLYSVAQAAYRSAGDADGEAEAQQGRGLLALSADELPRAQTLLAAAFNRQRAAGDLRSSAVTRLFLGDVALRRGDTSGARRELRQSAAELERAGDAVAAGAALGERAALENAAGSPALAESLLTVAIARIGNRVAPQVSWQLHAQLGAVLRREGATDRAAAELTTSIADVERAAGSLVAPERRSSFLADKTDAYVELALLERARGRVGAAFEASERARAREMLALLGQGRLNAPADAGGELMAREQDLRRRIDELTQAVSGIGSRGEPLRGPDVARVSAVAREKLSQAQREYAELVIDMRERAPRHASLISRDAVDWRNVARRLAPNEAFVEFLVGDTSSVAFVVTHDTIAAVDLHVGRHALATSIEFVRGTLQPRGSPRLDSLWRAPLRELQGRLLSPIEDKGLLRGMTRLIVVPHGDLHYLPFAALIDASNRYAIERYEIAVVPSAAVWLTLGTRPAEQATSGVLVLGPRPEMLPASAREVDMIGRLFGSAARVLRGGDATETAFRAEAPARRVLHLATYGVLNKQNPLFSFVDLARSGADDGRLEVHEVFGLGLNADLVVLSACQTALGSGALSDVPAGDDWIGLTRAFLHAGADRVVASLWLVDDRATAQLMERFYTEYRSGAAVSAALAKAQRALLAAPTTAHPFYWAAFQVSGGK